MNERMTRRERRERRAERRREWQASRESKLDAARSTLQSRIDGLPDNGQPVLVGHHSERAHRRALERVDNAHGKVIEHEQMMNKHAASASALEHELDRSIYSDDDDAIERLQERIDELEAERDRMKSINQWFTRNAGVPRRRVPVGAPDELVAKAKIALAQAKEELELTDREWTDVLNAMQHNCILGYPPYALSNIGGNISRQRKRLRGLQGE